MRKKKPRRSPTKTRTGRHAAPPAATTKPSSEFEFALLRYKVCDFFDAVQAKCAAQPECGGILIGSYRGPHIEVTDYTESGPNDIASLSSFKRVDDHHKRAATEAWRRSNNTVTYAGEWHSHPSGLPHPSGLDLQTWQAVVVRLNTPCLFVIVTPVAWQVFRILDVESQADIVPLTCIEQGITGIVYE